MSDQIKFNTNSLSLRCVDNDIFFDISINPGIEINVIESVREFVPITLDQAKQIIEFLQKHIESK